MIPAGVVPAGTITIINHETGEETIEEVFTIDDWDAYIKSVDAALDNAAQV
jgi:hypothetical protein